MEEERIATDGGSHSKHSAGSPCVEQSGRRMRSKSASPRIFQICILRKNPPRAAAADARLTRVTVAVGRVDVALPQGAKHRYTVLKRETDPAPLQFPDDALKKIVTQEECQKHYIHFEKNGNVTSKTWICGVCGKQCAVQASLMHHVLVSHLTTRAFSCIQCPKTFKTRAVLQQHASSAHVQEKRFVCVVCQKRFGRASVLIQHRRLHSEPKQFSCHCGKAFHQKVNLTMHQQRMHHPSRRHQPPRVYTCLACSAQLASLDLLRQHKLTCLPLLDSLRSAVRVNPDTERRLDAGKKRSMNHKLLSKIQSIVQQQERLRLERGDSPPSPPPAGHRSPTAQPTVQQQTEEPQQRQQQQQPASKAQMLGVLTAPIGTRSMRLARQRGLQPFVLLQGDGEEPTLAKVLTTNERLELLVPASTDDLRQLHQHQTGHQDSGKVDVPVVAMVTRFYDEKGTPHVRVQPPSSERPGSTALATSQVDLGTVQGEPPSAAPADGPSRRRSPAAGTAGERAPSPVTEHGPQGRGLSMPSGAELLGSVSLPAAAAELCPDRPPSAGGLENAPEQPPAGPDAQRAPQDVIHSPSDRPSSGETPLMTAGETPLMTAGETPLMTTGETPLMAAGETPLMTAGETPLMTAGETPLMTAGVGTVQLGASLLTAGDDATVQFVTADGELRTVSMADVTLLFSHGDTSCQRLPVAEPAGAAPVEVPGAAQ